MEYELSQRQNKWLLGWTYETKDETLLFGRAFKRRHNALVFLARLKDNQIGLDQMLRWLVKRESKAEAK